MTQVRPDPRTLANAVASLLERGDLAAADRALAVALADRRPPVATLVNAGQLRRAQGRLAEAEAFFRQAVRRDPGHAKARFNLGITLIALDRLDEAAVALTLLLERDRRDGAALSALGWLRGKQKRFSEALDCFLRAEAVGMEVGVGMSETALGYAHACDWSRRDAFTAHLRRSLAQGRVMVDRFAVMAHADDPALQRRAGEAVARTLEATLGRPPILPRPASPALRRVRVGYLSSDFHRHATAELLVGVLEHHDRAAFDVTAYSFGPDDDSDMQHRVRAAPERFVALGLETPQATVARMRADRLDILVDLKGYTEGARPEIAALRAAPVQVSHLGYPASMGAPWIDYMIADATVLPFAAQPDWAERIVHLPDCYQPNDLARAAPAPDRDRAAHGLPTRGIVFACFNNSYKFTPERFALWMHLLRAEPDSVLWLLESNPLAATHLGRAAAAAGVDPVRLVFAPLVDPAAHLARHGCADVFLDTAPYGAHTTASNALWMGLPVVTLPGRCFASRVAASLLRACGLAALIAADDDAYVAIARALAHAPDQRAAIAHALVAQRATLPAFDTARHTRALEAAYLRMVERAAAGEPPAAFAVGASAPVPQLITSISLSS